MVDLHNKIALVGILKKCWMLSSVQFGYVVKGCQFGYGWVVGWDVLLKTALGASVICKHFVKLLFELLTIV